MRYIMKGQEPEVFTVWKASANSMWVPSYQDLHNPEKSALHVALITEQLGTCCYCGRTIAPADSHIEHFAPQEHYQNLALDFANLHASCMRGTLRGDPLHCGHGKGSDYDPHRAIVPTDTGCESRFSYKRHTGAITATEPSDASALYMIDLLKLDISFLRSRRLEALDGMFDEEFEATASVEDLERLAQEATTADSEGRRTSFGHVLARHAQALIALKSLR